MKEDDIDLRQLQGELKAELGKLHTSLADMAEKANGKISAEMKKTADGLIEKGRETDARLLDIEQKLARRGSDDPPAAKSIGQQMVQSEEFLAWKNAGGIRSQNSSFVLKVNASTTTEDLATSKSTTIGVPPDLQSGVIQGTERRLRIRDLITPGRTSSNAVWYVKETGFTNNAAVVSEDNVKPQSSLTYELTIANVATIAHYFKASKQILDDFQQLQSMIDGRGRYGLKLIEENQLLKGSGVGQNLNGIYTQATAYSAPSGLSITSEQKMDRLRAMMLQAELAEYPPSGFVLHPTDWASIELTKDSQYRYIFGDPQSRRMPSIWGLPLVPTQAMTVDTALTGAFQLGAQIFDREEINVVIATQNEDDFIRNMITIRIEERLALAVYRPEAFIKDTNLPA